MSLQINLTHSKSNTFHPGLLPKQVSVKKVQQQLVRRLAANEGINLGVPKLPVGRLDRINPYQLAPADYKAGFMGLYNCFLLKAAGIPKGNPFLFYHNLMMAAFLEASGLGTQYKASPFTTARQKMFRPQWLGIMGQWEVMTKLTGLIKVKRDAAGKRFVVEVPLAVVDRLSLHAGMQIFSTYGDLVKQAIKDGTPLPPLPHIGPPPEDSEFKKGKAPKGKGAEDADQEDNGDADENTDEGADENETEANEGDASSATELVTEVDESAFLLSHRFKISQLAKHANRNLPIKVLQEVAPFIESLFFVKKNSVVVMMMRFTLDQKTSEALTCTAFNNPSTGEAINPADIFAFIRNWVSSLYGLRVKAPPRYLAPLHKIKASLPPGEDLRINSDEIAVDATGQFYMIPRQIDAIAEYNNKVSTYLRNEDGSYSEEDPEGKPKINFPANEAVFVDWVNKKFTYTNTLGAMGVLDMDRFQSAQPRHYARWFNLPFNKSSGQISSLISFLRSVVPTLSQDLQFSNLAAETQFYVREETGRVVPTETLRLSDTFSVRAEGKLPPLAALLIEACKSVDSILKKDYKIAYTRYSVMTSVRFMALAHVIAVYAEDLEGLLAIDRESRSKYTNQSLDPNYKPEPLPFVKDDTKAPMSVLPHQKKVLNLMRTSPDFALWGVAAGGGKTPLSVLNYLLEMKRENCKRILVLCPKSLVSTHVKDITAFTNGRINIIPVTDYTVRRFGLDRLQQMIDKAPINSVIISYFDMLGRSTPISYGAQSSNVYVIAEWLRQFNFDYCVIDEIHQLRNPSKKQAGVHRLISGIKKIRGMSGTLVANQLQDLAPQVALLDPTLFGSQEEFKKEFGDEFKGGKVLKWKEGAQTEIMDRIKSNVGFIQINRREWAALLPKMMESFYVVRMTEAQSKVYRDILTQARQAIDSDPKMKKKLDRWLKKANEERDEGGEDPADALDTSESMSAIQSILKPYLARLERFVSAPHKEPAGRELLEGVDMVSPKIVKAGEICTKHVEQNVPGKIIVFTNYEWTAEDCASYLDSLPALKGRVLLYTAAQSEAVRAKFESNPKYVVCVGIGDTLSTGLNLQFASRLIRLETVWTPGEYEQGNSRINRPNIQVAETRPEIFVDTIIAEDTIDVTKCAYLMSKIITAEKFYNHGDRRYDDLEEPPLFSMTLDNILNMGNLLTLKDHYEAFSAFKQAQEEDYREYRETHPKLEFTPVPRSGNLPGAALMRRTPYDPGTELYGADKLGLVRYDKYMGLNEEDLMEDEGSDEEEEDLSTREQSKIETQKVIGLAVHTDEGDGEIVSAGRFRLRVRLYSSQKVLVKPKLSVFIITRANTNSKDMRILLAKQNPDLPMLDAGEEPEVPANEPPVAPKKKAAEEVKGFELSFTIINGMLAISVDNAEDQNIARAAQQFGFTNPPEFIYAKLSSFKQFHALIQEWGAAGLKMPSENSAELLSMYNHMRSQGVRGVDLFDFARKSDFRIFHRMTFKPDSRKEFIKPFPYIEEDTYNVALPWAGQVGTRKAVIVARRVPRGGKRTNKAGEVIRWSGAPAPKWKKIIADQTMYKFVGNKNEASATLKEILEAGFTISNLDELKQEFKELRFKRD